MALARLNRVTEATEGAGNCAFNAFALGFCDARVLAQVERAVKASGTTPDARFKRFIQHVASALSVECRWSAVASALLTLRDEDKVKLQSVLAPILRDMSINLALKAADGLFHFQQTLEPFMSAYSDYTCGRNGGALARDDIFLRHDFITKKFREMREEEIHVWWRDQGYQQFLQKMRNNGEWAGDLELARLARYFGVVLDVVREDFVFNVYGNYGSFPYLHGGVGDNIPENYKREIMDCLYDRDIIKRNLRLSVNDKGIEFNLPEFAVIASRLSNVPNYEKVNAFVTEHCLALKGTHVPKAWHRRCREELIQRNVIGRDPDNSKQYVFTMNANQAMMCLGAVPYYDAVMNICRQHYEVHPLLVLHNKDGHHWENTLALPTPEEAFLRRIGFFGPEASQRLMQDSFLLSTNQLRRSDEDLIRKFT